MHMCLDINKSSQYTCRDVPRSRLHFHEEIQQEKQRKKCLQAPICPATRPKRLHKLCMTANLKHKEYFSLSCNGISINFSSSSCAQMKSRVGSPGWSCHPDQMLVENHPAVCVQTTCQDFWLSLALDTSRHVCSLAKLQVRKASWQVDYPCKRHFHKSCFWWTLLSWKKTSCELIFGQSLVSEIHKVWWCVVEWKALVRWGPMKRKTSLTQQGQICHLLQYHMTPTMIGWQRRITNVTSSEDVLMVSLCKRMEVLDLERNRGKWLCPTGKMGNSVNKKPTARNRSTHRITNNTDSASINGLAKSLGK